MPQATAAPAASAAYPPWPAGLLLLSIRRLRGWTQPQLARALGWKTARVKAVEDGREQVAAEELGAIARTLDLDRWAIDLAADYARGGGRPPRAGDFDPNWEAYLLGLQVGHVVYHFLRSLSRAVRLQAGQEPA